MSVFVSKTEIFDDGIKDGDLHNTGISFASVFKSGVSQNDEQTGEGKCGRCPECDQVWMGLRVSAIWHSIKFGTVVVCRMCRLHLC